MSDSYSRRTPLVALDAIDTRYGGGLNVWRRALNAPFPQSGKREISTHGNVRNSCLRSKVVDSRLRSKVLDSRLRGNDNLFFDDLFNVYLEDVKKERVLLD
jgi:hypothetical protein